MKKTTLLRNTLLRNTTALAVALLVAATLPAIATSKTKTDAPPSDARRTFETFKALAGEWEGENGAGEAVSITFEVMAGGHSVVERFLHKGHASTMLTVYHLDGDSLMLTHYCMAGNQPRMRAAAYSDDGVQFELTDVTDLASPEEGHMHRAEYEFDGQDRFSTSWTFREKGVDKFTEAVRVARVK